jgi:DNA-binding transcriptional MerR regulator
VHSHQHFILVGHRPLRRFHRKILNTEFAQNDLAHDLCCPPELAHLRAYRLTLVVRSSISNTMRIGELSRRSGASPRSIRHYEATGLLKSRRSENGYREYHEDAVTAVAHIRWLISAGLSARTIREILPCVVEKKPKAAACDRTRDILKRELDRLENQVRGIRKSQRLLKGAIGPG